MDVVERSVVRAVVVDRDETVPLLHTRDPTDPELGTWWELPGGGIESPEDHREAIVRELAEEAGLAIDLHQVRPPNWQRRATFRYRGRPWINNEVIVRVRLPAPGPSVDGAARVGFEAKDHFDFRWWSVAEIRTSGARFCPKLLPELLLEFLAGEQIEEPFEHWS